MPKTDVVRTIFSEKAPKPLGHYSQAVVHGGLVYVAGQLPLEVANPSEAKGDIETQTRLTLAHLKTILEAAGSDVSHVLKVTIYLSDLSYWPKINEIYGQFFGETKPARSAVPTKDLPRKCLLEIDAIAAVAR